MKLYNHKEIGPMYTFLICVNITNYLFLHFYRKKMLILAYVRSTPVLTKGVADRYITSNSGVKYN